MVHASLFSGIGGFDLTVAGLVNKGYKLNL